MAFSIHKELSKQLKTLAISLVGPPLPRDPLLAQLIEEELSFRLKEGKKGRLDTLPPYFRIRHSSARKLLQLLASAKCLQFEGKPLICDFFTPLHCRFHTEGTAVTCELYATSVTWKAHECDLISAAAGGLAIARSMLFFFDDTLSAQEILPFANGPLHLSPQECMEQPEPLPILQLEERSGALATLLVDYGTGNIFPFGSELAPSHKFPRNSSAEKALEKDLIECGYTKKQDRYYCPVSHVAQALELLLSVGWRVYDFQKRELVPLTQLSLHSCLQENVLSLSGKVSFGNSTEELTPVAHALKEAKLFLPLDGNRVGLLANDTLLSPLRPLLAEIEIIGSSITLPRNRVALVHEQCHTVDESVRRLLTKNSATPTAAFQGTLRPYQQHGVDWLHSLYTNGFSGILADDMGLGKTVQILAFLSHLSARVLIIAPTTLLFQWEKEIEKFLPMMPLLLYHGPNRSSEALERFSTGIILSSYGIVRQEQPLFHSSRFDCLIVDEAQTMKNHDTQTFAAVSAIPAPFRLSVTGTPIENSLLELWTQFAFVMPAFLGPKEPFTQPLPKEALLHLRKKIAPFFLRRTKENVAPDLPEKIEQTLFVTMTDEQRRIYDTFIGSMQQGLLKKIARDGAAAHRMEVLEAILRLRQLACHPQLVPQVCDEIGLPTDSSAKTELVLNDIAMLLADGKKIILFSQFTSMLRLLANEATTRGWNYLLLDGSTTHREEIVNAFQNDESVPLLLASLKAGGVGLNLTRADYVLLFDPWWNRAQEAQAIDRAHRIGRQGTVVCKRYIVKDSIEEKILALQEKKQAIARQLLEDTDMQALSSDDLLTLLDI